MLPIFVYPNPHLTCLIQASIALDCIVVRSFAIHSAAAFAALRNVRLLAADETVAALSAPVPPVAVTRATAPDAYLRLRDLPGLHATVALPADTVLREIAQTALVPDAALLGAGACSERAEWVVFADRGGQLYGPVNRTLMTHAARAPKAALYGERQLNSVLTVRMPFADADFARAAINVKASPACGIVYDAAAAYAVLADGVCVGGLAMLPESHAGFAWPRLQIDAPAQLAADAYADIAVQLLDGHTGALLPETGPCIYLESHEGYLPRRKLVLTEGSASSRIGALGLQAGDRLRIKAGWRYFPGLAEAEIAIV